MQARECLYPLNQKTFIGARRIQALLGSAEESGAVRGSKGENSIIAPTLLLCSWKQLPFVKGINTPDADKEQPRDGIHCADPMANQTE